MEACYRDGTPPPYEAVERIIYHPNFAFIRDTTIENAKEESRSIVLETTKGTLVYDYLILATGFEMEGKKQPELKLVIDQVQLWETDRESKISLEKIGFIDHLI